MKIAIIGATGFLGRNLVKAFNLADYNVLCLVRNINKANKLFDNYNVAIEYFDLSKDVKTNSYKYWQQKTTSESYPYSNNT